MHYFIDAYALSKETNENNYVLYFIERKNI